MTLIHDAYEETWVWVTKHDHDLELSPHFDDKESAEAWLNYIKRHINEAK